MSLPGVLKPTADLNTGTERNQCMNRRHALYTSFLAHISPCFTYFSVLKPKLPGWLKQLPGSQKSQIYEYR